MLAGCDPFFGKAIAAKPDIEAIDPRLEADCRPAPAALVPKRGEDPKAYSARVAGAYADCYAQHHQYASSVKDQRAGLSGK